MSSYDGSQYSFEDLEFNYKINGHDLFDDDRTPLIPPLVKWQAKVLDPNEGRCLISNASRDSGVTYIHCLPLRIRENRKWKGRLEWYWGLRWGELDLQSPSNVFAVSRSLGGIFDFPKMKPSWILLPEDHVVDKFYDALTKLDRDEKPCEDDKEITTVFASRGSLPVLEETTFKYRLFPLPHKMESMLITRQPNPNTTPDQNSAPPTPDGFSVHLHPFDTLPWVTSHLDPKLVIMEAGRKLMLVNTDLTYKKEWYTSRPALRKMQVIAEAWRAPIPSVAFGGRFPDYYTPQMGCCLSETVDDITQRHRETPYFSDTVSRRREKEAKEYAKRRGYSAFDSKQLPPQRDNGGWTAAQVARWSQDVSAQVGQTIQDVDTNGGTDGSQTPPCL